MVQFRYISEIYKNFLFYLIFELEIILFLHAVKEIAIHFQLELSFLFKDRRQCFKMTTDNLLPYSYTILIITFLSIKKMVKTSQY